MNMIDDALKPSHTMEIESEAEELLRFAINREDVKAILGRLPDVSPSELGAVEYELQLLKIICVGWSISYFLEDSPLKNPLAAAYWRSVHAFSGQLSEAAGGLAGKKIDYFGILRERLNDYVDALKREIPHREPVAAIGPAFAKNCGKPTDVHTIMAGTRMFSSTVGQIRSYLENHLKRPPTPCDPSKLH